MTSQRLKIPEQNVRDYAHELALTLARKQLAAIGDIQEQCRKSGATYIGQKKSAAVDFLTQSYLISIPGGKVSLKNSRDEVPVKDKILILDYFTHASGAPLTGKPITYKELHDGLNYFSVFHKRAIQPIVDFFGAKPEELPQIAAALGGQPADYGDVAVTIPVFPRVPLTLALWRGDAEFGPEGSILFDSTVSDYLTNDDIHALCEGIAWKLVRLLKSGGDSPGS